MNLISNELKKLRMSKKLSQKEWASLIGVTQEHISNVENGRYNLSRPAILLLSVLFGENAEDLKEASDEYFNKRCG